MKRPWPVTVLILLFLIATLGGIYNLMVLLHSLREQLALQPLMRSQMMIVLLGIGQVLLPAALAYGLWRMRNWARVILIGLSGLEILSCLLAVILGAVKGSLPAIPFIAAFALVGAICGVIIWYFQRPPVRELFV
jgi:hypothetical protein